MEKKYDTAKISNKLCDVCKEIYTNNKFDCCDNCKNYFISILESRYPIPYYKYYTEDGNQFIEHFEIINTELNKIVVDGEYKPFMILKNYRKEHFAYYIRKWIHFFVGKWVKIEIL